LRGRAAGLDDLPDTIRTRSVIIRMRRRAPGERVEPWRHRINAPEADPIAKDLARWVETSTDLLGWPDMPVAIEDRNADMWGALLAIADLAAGDWSDRARKAAVTLVTAAADRGQSLGIQLLKDLRIVFGDAELMFTESILDELHALEESPWGNLRGNPLDARGLVSRLRKYEVHPKTVRLDGDHTAKGYRREDLADLWSRYVSPFRDSADTSVTTSQSSATQSESVTDEDLFVTDDPSHVTDSKPLNHAQRDVVTDVTDKSEDGPASNGHSHPPRQGVTYSRCQICGTDLFNAVQRQRGTCGPCHMNRAPTPQPSRQHEGLATVGFSKDTYDKLAPFLGS
jgi:hypothetical protein